MTTPFTSLKMLLQAKKQFLLFLVAELLISTNVFSQNVDATWGANNNSAWYTGTNWAGGNYPGKQGGASSNANTATFTSVFTGTTVGINMNTANLNLGAVSVDNTRTTALNIGNSSSSASGVLRFYGATVNSVANVILRNNGSNLLTLQDAQSGGGTMGVVLSGATDDIINIDGAGGITITAVISGTGKLTKGGAGAGNLLLSTGNTYTGITTINSGFIGSSGESAFGANPGSFVANQITLNGGGILANGGNISFSSNRGLTLGASGGTFNTNSNTITLTNVVTGSGGILKTGAGTLDMDGSHTFTGGVTINAGTVQLTNAGGLNSTTPNAVTFGSGSTGILQLNGNSVTISGLSTNATVGTPFVENNGTGTKTLTLNTTGANTYAGVLRDGSSGTLVLSKSGSGSLTLTGANTYTGGTTLSAGTLNINSTTAIGTGALTISASGVTFNNSTAGSIALSNNNNQNWNGNFIFTGTNALDFGSGTATLGASVTATISASTLTVGGVVSGSLSTYSLTKAGGGTLVLSNVNNTYSGSTSVAGTTITGGFIATSGEGAFGNNPASFNGAYITLNGGGIQTTGTSSINFTSNRGITIGSSGGTFDVPNSSSAIALTNVTTGSGNILKTGAGLLSLAASHTFTGGVTINAGTVQLNNAGGLNSTSPNAITFGASSTGTLQLHGFNITISGLNTNATVGTPIVEDVPGSGTTTHTLTVNTSTVNTFAGVLRDGTSGILALTKSGSGSLTLSGTNTYTGATAISGGVLNLTGSLAFGSAVTISSSGTLTGTGTAAGTVSVSGIISPATTAGAAGTLATGSETWFNGGSYPCDITGTGSTNCDRLAITGGLTPPASGTFTINASLSAISGTFNSSTSYSWVIGTYTTSATLTNVAVSVSGVTYAGIFSLSASGGNINLVYTPPSITTNNASFGPYCNGVSTTGVSVAFTYTPAASFSGATFTAVLSDATGSFLSGTTNLGTVASNSSGSQSISATIPSGVAVGTAYRIKVNSTTPTITGSNDNGNNITINAPPAITGQPSSPSAVCAGTGTPTFTVTATGAGLSYVWKESTDGGSTFPTTLTNTGVYSGTGTASLVITNPPATMNGYKYQVTVSGTCASPATSDGVATLTVNTSPAITGQPASPSAVCAGTGTPTFTVTATGAGLTYVWKESTDGGSTFPTTLTNTGVYSGTGTANLVITNPPATMNGYKYRVTVSGTCTPSVNSDGTATLSVNTSPAITGQPASPSAVCAGTGTPTFAVTATGAGLSYVWKESTDGGSTFPTTLTNTGVYSGTGTASLVITNPPATMNGYKYRVTISGTCTPSVNSDGTATLTVNSSPNITGQPASPSAVCAGTGTPTFVVTATGAGLTYVWKESTDGGSTFPTTLTNTGVYSGTGTASLVITNPPATMNGYKYRVTISGTCTPSVNSDGTATLTVNSSPNITGQPASPSAVCAGTGTPTFTVTATGAGLTYVWKESTDGGSTFPTTLTNTGVYSGTGTANLVITNPPATMNGYKYRVTVGGTCTPSVNSDGTATLTVNNSATSIAPSGAQSINTNVNGSTLTVSEGSTPTSRVWKYGTSTGSYSTNTGVTATTYTPNFSAAGTYYVVCQSTYASPCGVTTSNEVVITVSDYALNTSAISGSPFCAGTSGISVPFTYSLAAGFPSGGSCVFTAELSDASGSFSSPVTLQNVTSDASGSQSISVTIPSGTVTGSGYRIRVISNSPAITGTDNGTNLTINALPAITGQPSSPAAVCAGTGTPTFTVTATGAGLTYVWKESTDGGATFPTTLTNTGVYSGTGTASLVITNPPAIMNGYKYRVTVSGTCTPSVNSDGTATLSVNTSPAITGQPSSPAAVCAGTGTPTFTVTATGAGLTYVWKESTDGGATFPTTLTNTGVYSGTGTASLVITNPPATMNGYKYRVTVSGTCTPSVNSDGTATLTVNSSPNITGQPSSPSAVCAGTGTPTFTVTATGAGLSYVWKESTDGGSTFPTTLTNTGVYSGTGTASLVITNPPATMNGYKYRVTVSGTCTPSVNSDGTATLSVNTSPAITGQPSSPAAVCAGTGTPTFTVTATGAGLSYVWKESTDGGSTFPTTLTNTGVYSGTGTASLVITNPPATMNGYKYRVTVSGTCTPSLNSDGTATLTVNTSPAITGQPASPSAVCAGTGTPTFTVTATGAGLTYVWKESTDGGATYPTTLTNTGVYSGTGTASLVITNPPATMNSYKYRVTISGTCTPSVNSDGTATLTVNSSPNITGQPSSPSAVCAGTGTPTFTVTATGAGLSYVWKESTDGGATYPTTLTNTGVYSGTGTASLVITNPPATMNGNRYRVTVSGTCTPSVNSNGTATLTVNTSPAITGQPASPSAICAGTGTPTFTVTATGAGLSYVWKESTDGGSTFPTTLTNTGVYSGTGTASLVITNPPATMNGYKYRVTVSGTCTPSVNSDGTATLTVNSSPNITGQPSSPSAVCAGTGTPTFTVTATGAGLSYVWKESTDGGSTFPTTLTNTGVYSGTGTASLVITNPPATMNGYKYRVTISGTCTPSINSNGTATLTVNSSPSITGQPGNPTAVCALTGTSSTFTVTATGAGLSYVWKESTDGGATFPTTLTNTGVYSGTGTASLVITNPPATMNGYKYRVTVSGTCTPSVNSNGAATLTVNDIPVAPVANSNTTPQTTNVNTTDFLANWATVSGATSYKLDVATTSTFLSSTTASNEDFESNNLSNWGNTGNFNISTSSPLTGTYSLRLNAPSAQTTTYTYTQPSSYDVTAGTTVWRFNIKTNYAPSTNNNASVFLMANQSNLTGANGYVVGCNFTGSDDLIKLWRCTSGAADLTMVASTQAITSGTIFGVEVTRSGSGVWTLKYKSGGGFTSMTTAGTYTETTYTNSTYAGLYSENSSSNNTNLRFDDFSISATTNSILSSYNDLTVNGTSQSVTGLTANTTYYYRVRATNACGTSSNSNSVMITTSCFAPTSASTSLSFSSVTNTTFNLNWTNGNGSSRIVVLKESSAPTGTPSNNTTYSANSNFTSAGALGDGFVVYNGTSNTVSLTNLTPGKQYFAKIFEYNCAPGSEKYYTTPATGNTYTKPDDVTLTEVCTTNSTYQLSWTYGNGDYDGVIILARAGTNPPSDPTVDASTYTGVNSNYTLATGYAPSSQSKLVYKSNGTSVTITGLTSGQAYVFKAYTYKNNTGTTWSTGTLKSQTISVPNVTGASASADNQQLNLTWVNPSSCFDEIMIVGNAGSVSFTPTGDGTGYTANSGYSGANQVVYKDVTTGTTVTNLTNGTNYCFEIFTRIGTQWSTGVQVCATPTTVTQFTKGDLAIVAVNTQVEPSGSTDEVCFISFKDITPGTSFYMTDNGYERANAGKWGTTEGVVRLTRLSTASAITAGTVICIDGPYTTSPTYDVYVCGTNDDANWQIDPNVIGGGISNFDLNGNGDQLWIMQGGSWTNSGSQNASYNGNLLYGWTSNGWNTNIGTTAPTWTTAGSRMYPKMDCFTTDVQGKTYIDKVKYTGSTSSATKFGWIARMNNSSNWTSYSTNANYDAAPSAYDYVHTCVQWTVNAQTETAGTWRGTADDKWFNCANWDTKEVPDSTFNVTFPSSGVTNNCNVQAGEEAKCNDLTINGAELNAEGNNTKKITVKRNLGITGGVLDLSDNNNATADGILTVYGNWSNYDETAFKQGNATVNLAGTNQTISCTTGTEYFYDLNVLGSGTKTLNNNISTDRNLTISTPAILAANGNNITVTGNWTNWGTGGFTEGTAGTVTFNGAATQTITSPGGENFYNVTISNSTSTGVTLANDITLANDLDLGSNGKLTFGNTARTVTLSKMVASSNTFKGSGTAAVDMTGAAHNLYIGCENAGFTGTLNGGTASTVYYNRNTLTGDQDVLGGSGITYYNLNMSGSAGTSRNKTASQNININGNLLVDAVNYNASASGKIMTIAGNITLQNAGTFTDNCRDNQDIVTSGNAAQVFNANTKKIKCFNLKSTKSSGGISLTGSAGQTECNIKNDFALDYTGSAVFTDNANLLQVGDDVELGSSSSTASNFAFTGTMKFICDGAAVATDVHLSDYAATGAPKAHLFNLTIDPEAAANVHALNVYPTPSGNQNVYVDGTVNILNTNSLGTNFNPNGNIINVKGDWNSYNHAGLQATVNGNSKVIFNGGALQTITSGDYEVFYNMELNNSHHMNLNNTIRVGNQLTLTSGNINTGSYEVNVTNSATTAVTGHSINSFINGNLRRSVNTTGGYDFPVGAIIGTTAQYELANITLTASSAANNLLAFFNTGLPATMPDPAVCYINGTKIFDMLNAGYWTITPSNTYSSVTYNVTLNERGYTTSAIAPAIGVIKRHDTNDLWRGTDATGGYQGLQGSHFNSTISGGTATAIRNGVQSFSDFGIGSGVAALPVTLTKFDAQAENNKVVNVTWETSLEINNDHFEIQRSVDGNNFETAGTVQGFGNSTTVHEYQWVDEHPYSGISYYRLKQVDYNGEYSYSEIAAVNINNETAGVVLYPTITASDITVAGIEVNTPLVIKNMMGQTVAQMAAESTKQIIHVSYLPAGMYFMNGIRFIKE